MGRSIQQIRSDKAHLAGAAGEDNKEVKRFDDGQELDLIVVSIQTG